MSIWIVVIGTNMVTAGLFHYLGYLSVMKRAKAVGLLPVLIAHGDRALKSIEIRTAVLESYRVKWAYLNMKHNPQGKVVWDEDKD